MKVAEPQGAILRIMTKKAEEDKEGGVEV